VIIVNSPVPDPACYDMYAPYSYVPPPPDQSAYVALSKLLNAARFTMGGDGMFFYKNGKTWE
jgi:hypothetical protein